MRALSCLVFVAVALLYGKADASYSNIQAALKDLQLTTTSSLLSTLSISLTSESTVLTLLAPTETAFTAFLKNQKLTKQQFFSQINLVRDIALYAILPGVNYPTFLAANETLLSLLGQYMTTVAISGSSSNAIGLQGYLPTNIAMVTKTYPCGNSLLKVLDTVLVPDMPLGVVPAPSPAAPAPYPYPGPYPSLLNAIQAIPTTSTLYQLVLNASNPNNLTAMLADETSTLTLFAFVNDAVPAALATVGFANVTQLANSPYMPMSLCYGVLQGAYPLSWLTASALGLQSLFDLTPIQIYQRGVSRQVIVVGDGFSAAITSPAITAGASILYLVDAVPLPKGVNWVSGPATPTQAVLTAPALTTLQAVNQGIDAFGAVGLSNPNAVVTFLAPTNAAIAAYIASKNTTLASLASDSGLWLKKILVAHSFPGYYPLNLLTNNERIAADGAKWTVHIGSNKGITLIKVGGAGLSTNILGTLAEGPSWLVYTVDKVLI